MRESGNDIDNWTLGGIAVTVAAAVAAAVLFLQALVYSWESAERATKTVTPTALRDFRAEQASKLEGYAWVDHTKGLVKIPIERAMALEAAQLQADSLKHETAARDAAKTSATAQSDAATAAPAPEASATTHEVASPSSAAAKSPRDTRAKGPRTH